MSLDCTNNYLSTEDLLKALVTKDSDGNLALRIVEVEGCEEDGLGCDVSHLGFEDLLRLCIGVSECGKPAIRLAKPPVTP